MSMVTQAYPRSLALASRVQTIKLKSPEEHREPGRSYTVEWGASAVTRSLSSPPHPVFTCRTSS